jgi:protein transport protein SEC31
MGGGPPAYGQQQQPQQQPQQQQPSRVSRLTPGKAMPDGFGSTHGEARAYVEQAIAENSSPRLASSAPVAEAGAIVNALQIVCARLKQAHLQAAEIRQLASIEQSVGLVAQLLTSGELQDPVVISLLLELCGSFDRSDYATASRVVGSMVRSFWKDQKEWLKGFKLLGPLAKAKFGGPN